MKYEKQISRVKFYWLAGIASVVLAGFGYIVIIHPLKIIEAIPQLFSNKSESLNFAGEQVPLDNIEVKDRFYRQLLYHGKWHTQSFIFYKRSLKWFPVIEPILKKYRIPDDFKYLALAESEFVNTVSPKGAAGFWQFMSETAVQYGLAVSEEVDERFNVEKSTIAACKYLQYAYSELHNWTMAAASFNIGVERLKSLISKQNQYSYYSLALNEETSNYLYRILAIKILLTKPEKFGYNALKKINAEKIPLRILKIDTAISDIGRFAGNFQLTANSLKILNPWIMGNKLTASEKHPFTIILPKKGFEHLVKEEIMEPVVEKFSEDSTELLVANDTAVRVVEDSLYHQDTILK